MDSDSEFDLPMISELDKTTKEMNNKIQNIIDAYFLQTGKFVTIRGTIDDIKDIRSDFTLHGGPESDTICKFTICKDLQKRLDQEIDIYNKENLKPLNKRCSNHDEYHKGQIKEKEYHLQMAKELFTDIKKYISNEDDNNYVEIPFGNIKIMLDTINKSKGYVTYQYYWPDKIYLLGAHMGSVGGRMVHQMIDIEFIKKLNI